MKWSGSPSLRKSLIPLGSVRRDPNNARLHPEASLSAIRAAYTRFGQQKPIVVSRDGVVVAGNGQHEAAEALGWTHIAAVETELDGVERQAYAVADNQVPELARWDHEALGRLLSIDRFEPATLGFDAADVRQVLAKADAAGRGAVSDVDVPDVGDRPVSRIGDVWVMGGHRLMCGDSTDEPTVQKLMGGKRANLVLTDPPYGVSYVGKTKDAMEIENDGSAGLRDLLRASLGLAYSVCLPGAVWYVAAPAGPQSLDFSAVLSELKVWRQTLAWVKDSMVLGHSDYHYRHEAVYYGWVPGADHSRPPTRNCTSVLEFDRPKASREHPTMKPVPLWAALMGNSTVRGDICYEPFSGSGTTVVAAEQLGRRCFAIELDPRYVDVAVKRWQAMTGKKAVRESDGAVFGETPPPTRKKVSLPARAPVRRKVH